jgi:3-ketosteroid 9alpha-monooxygenase subunit A
MTDFEGYARGWFVVAWSTDLEAGAVKALSYFGVELVLYRADDGQPHVLDAYCPHLGAHLGIGGTVKGECIECPFHAWQFNGEGQCTEIPYASKIPALAKTGSWPVVERNGAIFVWHDPEGGKPEWEVPMMEDYGNPKWTDWYPNLLEGVKTRPKEIVENVADKAHFPIVHRTQVDTFENFYEGHMATQHTVGSAEPAGGGRDDFDIRATYYGPAFQLSDMRGVLHSRLFLAHTPIDEDRLDLRFAVMLKKAGARTDEFAQFYVDNLRLGFHEDIAIWENKVYRSRPRIVDGDGPIGRLRQWYRQFFGGSHVGA